MKKILRILVAVTAFGTTMASASPEIAEPLKAIRAVGPEGQGNVVATAAWKKLAEGNAASLLPIFEAMDGANDYALNWMRAAVDTIADRELKAGGKLPLPELGTFLLETRHNPKARRLAFELIAKVDANATDKLLAGMLNDPSLEIRRDAVQKVIGQANKFLESSNRMGAILLYQQALNSSRDVKQIENITKKLKDLDQPVDLLKLFGFLAEWKIIGPFDNAGNKGFEKGYPPEQKVSFTDEFEGKTGKVRWQDYTTKHKYGMVDMNKPYGKLKEVVAYAAAEFYSEQAQSVELRLGGKNSWKAWLNGKLLFERDEYHADQEIDQYPMPVQLQAGRNLILVKVCQNEELKEWTEEWEFQLRVTDALGTPIFSARKTSSLEASNASLENKKGN